MDSLGYSAQGGHPRGRLVLYPSLASLAGLGWLGHHGLLITRQFGARQTIGVIFTNIENLPLAEDNPHFWIENFAQHVGDAFMPARQRPHINSQ